MGNGPKKGDWRGGAAVPAHGAPSKSSSMFVAGLVAATLIGVLIAVVIWLWRQSPPSARYVNISLSDYSDARWPPVPFAGADADRLIKHFPKSAEKATTDRLSVSFDNKLTSLKDLNDRPLVVHIASLAVARNHRVYLLTGEAKPGEPDTNWYSLDDVLKKFDACTAADKLLILDLSHPIAEAARGVLADDVSDELNKALASQKKLSGLVMVTTGPGESSQTYDLKCATAFGYFMDQALAGHADTDKDHWVDVSEMFQYVRDNVARWSYFCRGRHQTVRLYGNDSFRLVSYINAPAAPQSDDESDAAPAPPVKAAPDGEGKTKSAPPVPVIKLTPALEKCVGAWEIRDQWQVEGARTKAPNLLHELESAILRAESVARAGRDETVVIKELDVKRTELTGKWNLFKNINAPPRRSLVGLPRPTELLTKLEAWLDPLNNKKFAEVIEKPKPEELLLAAWTQLAKRPLSNDKFIELCTEAAPPEVKDKYIEAAFIFKLRELATAPDFKDGTLRWYKVDAKDTNCPALAGAAAVKAEQFMLEAVASAGAAPECFQRLKAQIEVLDLEHAKAKALLWKLGNSISIVDDSRIVTELFSNITKQTNERIGYVEIATQGERYANALSGIADARAELPGVAALLARLDADVSADLSLNWFAAAQAAGTLVEALAGKDTPHSDLLSNQTIALNSAMERIRIGVNDIAQLNPHGGVASAIMAMPRLPAKRKDDKSPMSREAWWGNWRDWCGKLEKSSLTGTIPPDNQWEAREVAKAALRAKLALALARLQGKSVKELQDQMDGLVQGKSLTNWNNFAPKLLPLYPTDTGGQTSAARSAAQDRYEYWKWLADRYTTEARAGDTGKQLYLDAANDAGKAAETARIAAGS